MTIDEFYDTVCDMQSLSDFLSYYDIPSECVSDSLLSCEDAERWLCDETTERLEHHSFSEVRDWMNDQPTSAWYDAFWIDGYGDLRAINEYEEWADAIRSVTEEAYDRGIIQDDDNTDEDHAVYTGYRESDENPAPVIETYEYLGMVV